MLQSSRARGDLELWRAVANTEWNLRVVLLRDGELWVAQCLELDIAAQGSTIVEVQESFVRTFSGQAMLDASAGKEPFADFKPAPAWYVQKFEAALPAELAHKLNLIPSAEALSESSVPPIRAVAEVRVAT